MNLRYMAKELYYQRRRTMIAVFGLSIGIALLIILNALSIAYREAAQIPLKEIGADITVQRAGDVPEELSGAVFPCSAVTLRNDEVEKISKLPGLKGMGKALLLWVFDPDRAWIVLGIERENPIGPAVLKYSIAEGRFLENGKAEALVEVAYARQFGIKVGDTLSISGREFPVVGLVDASRATKIAVANVYLPLKEAEELAVVSKQLQSVSPYASGDVNLLFIKADQDKISSIASSMKTILGDRAAVATPDSFLKLLGSLFALSDKFTMVASLIAIVVAILIAFKTMAGNIAERAKEIGVLKAVGWTNRNVVFQLMGESVVQCFIRRRFGALHRHGRCLRVELYERQHPDPVGDEPDPAFPSGRRRSGFQDPAASGHCPLEPGYLCHPSVRYHRRHDRRVAWKTYRENQTVGGFKT